MPTTINREGWLLKATSLIAKEIFKPAGLEVPEVRVSIGWPSRGALSAKSRTIGQCWYASTTEDQVAQIFISPVLDTEGKVMETLVHELLHATLPEGTKHGAGFARGMALVGLEGKPTATHSGSDLAVSLSKMAEKIGPFPHAKISKTGGGDKKQSTRLLKTECPECGYIARVTTKWIEEVGPPICPMDEVEFQVAS